jgi:GT2 family glycosyltransferase
MELPKVAIIILNWNGLADTIECLESLKNVTYANFSIVVVDNGSKGPDAEVLGNKYRGDITLIRNDKNYGFAEGNNIAIKWALENLNPDYFLLLNNDTTVDPEFLSNLVSLIDADNKIGIVGPKIYYYGSPDTLQSFGARIDFKFGTTRDIGWKKKDHGQFDHQAEVDYVNGCAMLVRKQVVETIGLLDPTYFCYYEETDFCTRARKAGFRIFAVPNSKIWHKKKLIKKWGGLGSEEKGSDSSFYYMGRNVFIFMKNHRTKSQFMGFVSLYFLFKIWYTSAVCILYHFNGKQLIAFWRGVNAGLAYTIFGRKPNLTIVHSGVE